MNTSMPRSGRSSVASCRWWTNCSSATGTSSTTAHGAVILFLDKQSIRSMERDLGRRPVARLAEWLDAYKVRTSDGQTITIGHRTRRIWRT